MQWKIEQPRCTGLIHITMVTFACMLCKMLQYQGGLIVADMLEFSIKDLTGLCFPRLFVPLSSCKKNEQKRHQEGRISDFDE